jgi:putative transposase
MSRTARVVIPDLTVHIVQRGHDRRRCFFAEADHFAYLDLLGTFAPRLGCSVHAYCLMTNHIHLLVTPHAPDSCAQLMKNVGQRYVQQINLRLGRTGTLWEGRYHSCLVASERHALACYRYIECNPVRPGMVSCAAEYPWSSYRANVHGEPSGFLVPHPAYLALAEESSGRASAYRALCDMPLEQDVLDDIRKATRGGYVVGSARRRRGRPSASVMRKMGSVPI